MTAETREDRFWRLLDGKLGRYATVCGLRASLTQTMTAG